MTTETNPVPVEVALADTAAWMTSDDWRERLLAEYWQTVARADALARMLDRMRAGTLDFEPNCSRDTLHTQLVHMRDYLGDLRHRLSIERVQIRPPKKEEDLTSMGEIGCDEGLVQLGAVRAFDPLPDDYETIRKLVEECMELFSAWERLRDAEEAVGLESIELTHSDEETSPELERLRADARTARGRLMLELSDVVQCVANLAAAEGVPDMRPLMAACEARNRARGRVS